jgi:hypothetical protein
MRKRPAFATIVLVVLAGTVAVSNQKPASSEDGIAVYFSPDGSCTGAIVEQISGAKKAIMLQEKLGTVLLFRSTLKRGTSRDGAEAVMRDQPGAGGRREQWSRRRAFRKIGRAEGHAPSEASQQTMHVC